MLLDAIIISCTALSFAIMREPEEWMSWYNRALINLEDTHPNLHKALTCPYCHSVYFGIPYLALTGSQTMAPIPVAFVLTYLLNKILFR